MLNLPYTTRLSRQSSKSGVTPTLSTLAPANKANQIKSGDYGALGANRLNSTGAGFCFTTLIPQIEAAVNLSYMTTISSRHSLSGSFYQLRMSKAF